MTQSTGLHAKNGMYSFSHTELCMGTAFQFQGQANLSPDNCDGLIEQACQILHEADRTFSLYKPESPLSQLARGETSVAKLPTVVSEIWDDCERWEQITDGWFSAFTPQHTFDPSGLVKTWAANRAAEFLVENGILDFTLNAGGDILLSDALTDPVAWRVAIHKPVSIAAEEAGTLTVLDLKGTPYRAVATSGSAERGAHIWNPKAPEKAATTDLVQVTVVARDLVTADVWATAAFAQGDRAIDLLNAQNAKNPTSDIQALVVWPDGNLGATDGFMELFPKSTSR